MMVGEWLGGMDIWLWDGVARGGVIWNSLMYMLSIYIQYVCIYSIYWGLEGTCIWLKGMWMSKAVKATR